MSEPIPAPGSAQAPASAAPSNAAPVVEKTPQTPAAAAPASPATPPAAAPAVVEPAKEKKEGAAAEPGAAAKKEGAPDGQAGEVKKEDLKLPEGSLLDPKTVDEIVSFAKEKGLSKETAQKVLERESKLVSSIAEAEKAKLTQVQQAWVSASQSDKEFGGVKFAENAELGKRVVKRFGTPAFEQALESTGLGNHPELMRFAIRIGRAMSEDQLFIPGPQGEMKAKDHATILYGDTPKQGE